MGPIRSLADLALLVRRHMLPMAVVLSAGMLLTLAYALSRPSSFEAASLVQLPTPVLAGADQVSAAQRVQSIEQRLMRRESVLQIVQRHGLFADQPALTDDDRVFLFREATEIRVINAAGGPAQGGEEAVSALLISARAGTAQQAADVANDLTDSLIRMDRDARTQATRDALSFLDDERKRLTAQLARLDDQIGTIKHENEESLPAASEALRSEVSQLRELQLDLERQDLQLQRDQLAVETRAAGEGEGDGAEGLAQRLSRLTGQLAQSRRLLPETHPEIRRLEAEISALRRDSPEAAASPISREVELVDSQREAVAQQKRTIAARQAEIADALARGPVVEQQLTGLTRQQTQLVEQLNAVTLRLSEAERQRSLEDDGRVARMVVLETAKPPTYPLSSSRKRVAALGGMASLALSLLAGLALELRRPVMRTAAAVERVLGVAPIAAVPRIPSPAQLSRRRLKLALTLLVLAGAGAAGLAMLAAHRAPAAAVTAAPVSATG